MASSVEYTRSVRVSTRPREGAIGAIGAAGVAASSAKLVRSVRVSTRPRESVAAAALAPPASEFVRSVRVSTRAREPRELAAIAIAHVHAVQLAPVPIPFVRSQRTDVDGFLIVDETKE